MHQDHSAFPIDAIVTSTWLIDATVDACLEKYPSAKEITIGDVPLQSCDWPSLQEQAGLSKISKKYERIKKPVISFLDLRLERYHKKDGFLVKDVSKVNGDPKCYKEVVLNAQSFLEPVSQDAHSFRVSDYDPDEIISNHKKGNHRYLIAGTVLDADLIINMPKMKTHQKAGITGALKNLVGINGNKAFLVHHRKGKAGTGGDEFPSDVFWVMILQTRIRELLQKNSRILFVSGRIVWNVIKYLFGIKTEGLPENLNDRFYIAAGSWYGNDTVWRMIYDMNKIILYAPREGGHLATSRQRQYISIMDGVIAGEGNGPLQPIPVTLNILGFSNDPFLMDMAMARLMGFDYCKIPQLRNYILFEDGNWANFDPESIEVQFDEKLYKGINQLPIMHQCLPPPGWKGHIECSAT
jgi:hypothetical protein